MLRSSRALALAVVAVLVAPVAAHFAVSKSTPTAGQVFDASPKRLQIWFSQTPAASVSELKVAKVAGDVRTDVTVGKTVIEKDTKSMYVDIPEPLAAGNYALVWRGAGDDGHAQKGEITFAVRPKRSR